MLLKWIHDAYRKKDVCSASIIDLNTKHTLYIYTFIGSFLIPPTRILYINGYNDGKSKCMIWKFICHDAKKQKTQHQKSGTQINGKH